MKAEIPMTMFEIDTPCNNQIIIYKLQQFFIQFSPPPQHYKIPKNIKNNKNCFNNKKIPTKNTIIMIKKVKYNLEKQKTVPAMC